MRRVMRRVHGALLVAMLVVCSLCYAGCVQSVLSLCVCAMAAWLHGVCVGAC